MRFYAEYDIDAGQMMHVCDVFQATSREDAMDNWHHRVRGHVVYAHLGPDVLEVVPSKFDDFTDGNVLTLYKDKDWSPVQRQPVINPTPHMSGKVVTLGSALRAMFGCD